jgi:NDP-sugar pyrophosphorylase family protein
MKAIILCAGDGTRLQPLTANTPKPLVPLLDRTILEYVLDAIPKVIDEVYLVIKKSQTQAFDVFLRTHEFPFAVYTVLQSGENVGTWSALSSMSDRIHETETFLVMNGDDIFLQGELSEFTTLPTPVCGIGYKVMDIRYRTCDLDTIHHKIEKFRDQRKEEVDHPVIAFTGMYLLSGEFFKVAPVVYKGEHSIPDTVFGRYEQVGYYEVSSWYQVNTLKEYHEAKVALAVSEQPEDLLEEEM